MSLALPWSSRSFPKRNQWECWDPELGPNVVGLPVLLPPSDQPKAWQVEFLSHGWLVGQLQLASWLVDSLSNKMSTSSSPGRDILWPFMWQLWSHRPDYPKVETSHGQVWYYCDQAALWSDVPPPHDMRLQARFAFGQMSDQVNIMSDVPPIDDFYTTKDLLPRRVTI